MTFLDYLAKGLAPVFERWDREYTRGQCVRALRDRHRWHKADVSRLLRIGVPAAAQPRMARLFEGGGPRGGRGVVPPPRSLAEAIIDDLRFGRRLFSPATPPKERRKLYKSTRWWPYFVEAAYRGELRKTSASLREVARDNRYGDTASEIAEKNVAEAAGISAASVHALCQEVRNERKDWASRGLPWGDDPETSAAELKRHIGHGHAKLSELRQLK